MTDKQIDKFLEDEFIKESKRLDDIYSESELTDDILSEFEELEDESWEMVKLCDRYIHSMEYLTFHEKTWLYMSRNRISANELAIELQVSKYVLSKCRANPANNWALAKKLIKLCEEVGLPCIKELEHYRQQS